MRYWKKRQRAFRTIENLARALNPISQCEVDESGIYMIYGFSNEAREKVNEAYVARQNACNLQRKLLVAFHALRNNRKRPA